MVDMTNTVRRLRAPLAAALAALALAGCAATNVGEDWQCPLAQGSQCTSVAAADPAVNGAAGTARLAGTRPPVSAHRAAEDAAMSSAGLHAPHGAGRECASRCNPFGWLGRLFAGASGNEGEGADAVAVREPEGAAPDIGASGGTATAPATGENASALPEATGDADAGALRAPETIGRVWIAPWVDGDGVYREASWVRIVIAPAGWKRP